jgi:GTPase SAR1 family protein
MFDPQSEYQAVFDKISRVHSHGMSLNLSVPRMAIIGDQSSGKSSVLEAITKLSFPRDKGMCTRFATLVNLQRNPTLPKETLSAKIEGEDAFNKRFSVIDLKDFGAVVGEAVSLLCKDIGISDKVLELTLSGPTQSPLTIIDLPGFIRTTEDEMDKSLPEAIRNINRRFIKEPRTIILAVVPANNDLITSTSLSEAAVFDPAGERTIPIVTKPDRIEEGLLPDWVEVILNRRKNMKHGYLVMRNSGHSQKEVTWDESCKEEEKFFESQIWNAVSPERKGRVAIRKFLSKVLHEHISRELPAFKREVDAALDSFKKELASMGTPIVDINDARERLYVTNTSLQLQIYKFLNASYGQEYLSSHKNILIPSSGLDIHFVRSSLLKLYQEYNIAMCKECNSLSKSDVLRYIGRYKGNDLPGFVSFTTFTNIINAHYLDGWKRVTSEHILKIHNHLSEALSAFIEYTADISSRDVFTRIFGRFSRSRLDTIKATIGDIFEDEGSPFTLSSEYLKAVKEERSKAKHSTSNNRSMPNLELNRPNGDTSAPSYNSPLLSQTGSPEAPHPSYSDRTPSSMTLDDDSAVAVLQKQQEENWNDSHSTREMMYCLQAYLKAARERIVDKVLMQTIERYMVNRINDYFQMIIKASDTDIGSMLESPARQRSRYDYEVKIADFEGVLMDL